MNSENFSSGIPMSAEEIAKTIESGLPGLDGSRTRAFAQLTRLRDAKARSLAREQMLLAKKHGGTKHPRIAEAQQRFAANEQLRREIAVVREITETPLPEAGEDSLIVHGFVRRRSNQAGIAGLTLAFTDREGNWVRELGYACTDERGYFLLQTPVRSEERPSRETEGSTGHIKPPGGVSVDEARREAQTKTAPQTAGQTPGTQPLEGDARVPQSKTLQLRVFDRQGHVLHTERRPVALQPGLDFRQIFLGDEAADCGCVPPPAKAGGRPATTGPKAPAAPQPPSTNRPGPTPPSQPQVGRLKSFQQPAPADLARAATPSEPVRAASPRPVDKTPPARTTAPAREPRAPSPAPAKSAASAPAAPEHPAKVKLKAEAPRPTGKKKIPKKSKKAKG
jgi:hypothetical protein